MDVDGNIEEAARVLREADAVAITSGAGMGVDSGLPDFRGNEGFWKAYPPIAKLGISFVDMANPQWFDHRPELAWAFYGHRLNLYRETVPHRGFELLLKYAGKKNGGYFVFTSNVDGQFQKAGFDPDKIEECHGSIHHFQCCAPCGNAIWSADDTEIAVDEESFTAGEPLPKCKNCGNLARPNILMFGDWHWNPQRSDEQGRRMGGWLGEIAEKNLNLVVVEIGAGQAVPTVRMRSESMAHRLGGTLVRINPRDYDVPSGHISIPLGSEEGIARIIAAAD